MIRLWLVWMSFGPSSAKPFQEWKSLSGKADPALGTHAAVAKPGRAEIRAKRASQTSSTTFKQSSPSPGVAAVEASSAADAAAAFSELTKVATTLVAFTEKNDLDEKIRSLHQLLALDVFDSEAEKRGYQLQLKQLLKDKLQRMGVPAPIQAPQNE
jgi:hypothetical protein